MLSILGIVAIAVIAIQVYKSAKSTGRNPVAWTAIATVVGVGIQFVFPTLIFVAAGLYIGVTGSRDDVFEQGVLGLLTVITVGSSVLSIVGMWLVARHVATVEDDGVAIAPPPPPRTFDI